MTNRIVLPVWRRNTYGVENRMYKPDEVVDRMNEAYHQGILSAIHMHQALLHLIGLEREDWTSPRMLSTKHSCACSI